MNALSNVLNDVKYNNGLQDAEAPDPKRKFGTVTDAERGAQLASLETSGAFGVATICAGPLGLYEFTRFLGGRNDSARALGSLLLDCARYRASLATATRQTLRKRIEDVYLTGTCPAIDSIAFPHPHLKRTPLPDELKPDSPTSTKRLKTTSSSLKGTQWPFTSTKCHALKPSSDDQDALDQVDRATVRALSVYLPSFKRSEECRELLDFYVRQKRPPVTEEFDNAVEPPFAPGKAINAKDAESIGDFASLGDDVPLSDGDFDTERWNYVSPDAYQAEVVWLLQWEEEKKGPRKQVEMVAEKASSACAVS